MKKIIQLTLFLAIISAIAGGALAYVNSVTEPIITANALKEVEASLEEFFPGSKFTEGTLAGETEFITNVYESSEGVVYKATNQGYEDALIFLLAIDKDGNFVGYKTTQNNDTQGFGSRVSDAEFYEPFVGQPIDTKIDTLSGATVSSTAVVTAISEIVEYHNANY